MNRRARLAALAFCLLSLLPGAVAHAQDAPAFDPARVPAEGAREQDFVPAGWKVGARASGDLDADGRPDLVLQLVPRDYDTEGV
ncbi:MAG TPA: hypothetical protein VNZ44_04885, partial [Pyrinomonadaceae bacterium]|nr:hypothetical protein [Pyrinomonadaceae bacterium]